MAPAEESMKGMPQQMQAIANLSSAACACGHAGRHGHGGQPDARYFPSQINDLIIGMDRALEKSSFTRHDHDPRYLLSRRRTVRPAGPAPQATRPAAGRRRHRHRAAVAVVAGWRNSEHSVNSSRLRIADVTRGTLIRDAAVTGRVVASISPTCIRPRWPPSR
ncbi:hypothetical protein [Janthinobacterium agaricidamnosum]|uniref:hypothetical protein n=1 Tax=Janthinobacterium agaricidamnosum TaxID=55508 RepID=UPI001F09CE41|nr:hypothetical protein [Janthinobacterium agaricidamnosum]